jgi:hypothetical protein
MRRLLLIAVVGAAAFPAAASTSADHNVRISYHDVTAAVTSIHTLNRATVRITWKIVCNGVDHYQTRLAIGTLAGKSLWDKRVSGKSGALSPTLPLKSGATYAAVTTNTRCWTNAPEEPGVHHLAVDAYPRYCKFKVRTGLTPCKAGIMARS